MQKQQRWANLVLVTVILATLLALIAMATLILVVETQAREPRNPRMPLKAFALIEVQASRVVVTAPPTAAPTPVPTPAPTAAPRPSKVGTPPSAAPVASESNTDANPDGPIRSVSSTMYCLRGTMANGEKVHDGAVAMNGVPFGTKWRVLSGPMEGRTYTVKDRIGWGSQFDMWTGSCHEARQYGRHQIQIQRMT